MGTCLVTRYNVVINNSNLDYFDALQVKFDSAALVSGRFNIRKNGLNFGGVGTTIKVLSNCTITAGSSSGLTEHKITSEDTSVYLTMTNSSVDAEFLVIGMLSISSIDRDGASGTHIKSPSNLSDYAWNISPYDTTLLIIPHGYSENDDIDISGYVSSIVAKSSVTGLRETSKDHYIKLSTDALADYTSLTKITIYNAPSYGDISELENLTHLTELYVNHDGIYGDIASLGKMTSLATLSISNSHVSGNIEDFVAAQYDNGRTSEATGIVIYLNSSSDIYYNGSKINSKVKVTWEDRTTINVVSL